MTTERYTLIREVGEGGLGKVWLARDNDLAREVAIKEIKPGTESSQAARRLIREAQITGQLQHPNIVPVYGVNRGLSTNHGRTVIPSACAAVRWRPSLETNSVSPADKAAARCSASSVRIEMGLVRRKQV